MTISTSEGEKKRTVWAISMPKRVYDSIRELAIASGTSNSKIIAMAVTKMINDKSRKPNKEKKHMLCPQEQNLIISSLKFLSIFAPTQATLPITPLVEKIRLISRGGTTIEHRFASVQLMNELDVIVTTLRQSESNRDIGNELGRIRSMIRREFAINVCDDCECNVHEDDLTDMGGAFSVCPKCAERIGRYRPRVSPTSVTDDTPVFMHDLPIELD